MKRYDRAIECLISLWKSRKWQNCRVIPVNSQDFIRVFETWIKSKIEGFQLFFLLKQHRRACEKKVVKTRKAVWCFLNNLWIGTPRVQISLAFVPTFYLLFRGKQKDYATYFCGKNMYHLELVGYSHSPRITAFRDTGI